MATLTAAAVASTVQPKETHQHVIAVHSTYELTAALAGADVIQMVKVPKGAQILEIQLATDDLDTGAALVLDVGDGGDPDRFIDGSTIGQTGGSARLGSGVAAATAAGSFGYTYTTEDTIDVTVATAPGTGATEGTVALTVLYHCD